MGSRTLGVAYPLLALAVMDSPISAGWVAFASTLPGLLVYVPAGVLVDRWGYRRVMLWSESLRVLAVASVIAPPLLWNQPPPLAWLLLMAFIEGALWVFYSLAQSALVPSLVRKRHLASALAWHEVSSHVSVLLGRSIGGVLHGVHLVAPFLSNIVMSLMSLCTLAFVKSEPWSRSPRASFAREVADGAGTLWRHPFLSVATILTGMTTLMTQALIMIFINALPSMNLAPVLVGVLLAASGIGGALGAGVVPRRRSVMNRIFHVAGPEPSTRRLTWLVGMLANGRSILLVHAWVWVGALTTVLWFDGPIAFGIAMFVMGLAGSLSNVTIRTIMVRVAPGSLARVFGVSRLVSHGAVALGPLLGAALVAVFKDWAVGFLTVAMVVTAGVVTMVPSLRRSLSTGAPVAA